MKRAGLQIVSCGILIGGLFVQTTATIMPDPLKNIKEMYDKRQYKAIIDRLSDSEIEKLPRQHRPLAYFFLGKSHEMRKDMDKALGVFQVSAQIFPNDINLLSELASVLQNVGLEDRASPVYEHVLKIHPNNARAHLGLAHILHSQGFWEQAADHYRRCLQERQDDPRVWLDYARALTEQRNYSEAMKATQKSLSLDSSNIDSLRVLADVEYRQGMRQKAYATLERALAVAGKNSKMNDLHPAPASDMSAGTGRAENDLRPEIALQLALWLLEEGRLEKSLAQVEAAFQQSPGDPLGLWIRAMIYLKRGRTHEARQDLETVTEAFRRAPFVSRAAQELLKEL